MFEMRKIRISLLLWFLFGTVSYVNAGCRSFEFECDNKECVHQYFVCDNENDCSDNTDEKDCELKNCSSYEYKCPDGRCILSDWLCDGENDCGDNSDESKSNCENKKCKISEFSCETVPQVCVPITWICDGDNDCPNNLDEQKCEPVKCKDDEFTCQNNKCIMKNWMCDGRDDCGDGSDEKNCPIVIKECSSLEFRCDNRTCIPEAWKCDDDKDCEDGLDEKNCEEPNHCRSTEFTCVSDQSCIHQSWVCDGDRDCPDGSDEFKCSNTCRSDQFLCNNHQCIPIQLRCNGLAECPDKSDEENCGTTTESPCDPKTHFQCSRGACISLIRYCDSRNDCGDWEDEPSSRCRNNECMKSNGYCSQKCILSPSGYYCDCIHGYKLIDNHTCEDIDECNILGSCSQICSNTKGDFKCSCFPGYDFEPGNHHRCKAKNGNNSLIFSTSHGIRIKSLNAPYDYRQIISEKDRITFIDYIYNAQLILWYDDTSKAIKTNYVNNPLLVSNVFAYSFDNVNGLAVDWIHEHVYWSDSGKKTIEVIDILGTMHKTLINANLKNPGDIAINPEGWIYFIDSGESSKIERSYFDGTKRETIISTDIEWPTGLTLDLENRYLFWCDAKLNSLFISDLNGERQRVIFSSLSLLTHPTSIAVFEDWLYWTEKESKSIYKINKFTGKEMEEINAGYYNPKHVHVFHPYKQRFMHNHCNRSSNYCSHFCFLLPIITERSAKFVCSCPDGMELKEDQRTCRESLGDRTTDEIIPTKSSDDDSTMTDSGNSTQSSTVSDLDNSTANTKIFVNLKHNDNLKVGLISVGLVAWLLSIFAVVIFLFYRKRFCRTSAADHIAYVKFKDQVNIKKGDVSTSLEALTEHP